MSDVKIPKEGEIQDGELWFVRRGMVLTLGLTNRAMDTLGDLEDLGFPEEGDVFEMGDAMVSVDGNRGSLELAAPGRGTVLEVNPAADAEVVTSDPLEEGWLVKFQVEDLEELRYLISENAKSSSNDDEEEDDSDEDEDEELEEEEEDEAE